MERTFQLEVGGRTMSFLTGKLAKQANGAVMAAYGDTRVLVTATCSKEPREGIDFFPLTVDYEERLYAAGKIPGGFIKREGRPGEKAILAARLIDRPIRPLFPEGFRNDVHIVATVMSVDQDHDPRVVALCGASVALTISDIPFNGPIGAVIVGRVDGKLIINPNLEQSEKSDMHIVVAGTKDAVMMVEAAANEVPEDEILEAIMFAHEEIKKIVEFQIQVQTELAVVKREIPLAQPDPEMDQAVRAFIAEEINQAVRIFDKQQRQDTLEELRKKVLEHFQEQYPEREKELEKVFHNILKETVRQMIITEGIRPDGRKLDEIRPIWCEVGVLPRTHGSAIFTRGQTQVLTVTTLGAIGDEQILDDLGVDESKRYMHHYNFPPYSTGEARPLRAPSRREIGHGALAERALEPMIPDEKVFPYTIRLVSEVLESNGSSSMASVCGSTLSLMDAGVPIKRPVSGVAMGLVKEGDIVRVLTDIQGMEDALGDMDFKVAGTEIGVTAIQMDIKIAGIDRQILKMALEQARQGRLYILQKMLETLPAPRKELSPWAPRLIFLTIHPDKIRTVIGPGGKTIKKIIDETGVKIDIEDDGRVFIYAIDQSAGRKAQEMIEELTEEVEVGKTYLGKVVRIVEFGAFVEVLPGKEGLVHISQLSEQRVNKVEDVVSVGDQIPVKVIKIDDLGRINLSRKQAIQEEKQKG
ncbi:polyribonucleotide nucleotidyltransferase [Carboxydocella sporoproducens DSM 16521]|uniref:Polyribonucleotide nucleotidyltransferase n=2 Tax=Carboxydocella TaxID=178898 RepID=A0A1T4P7R1_9FIRM|nr:MULTISPECIES: polyribonucleotide nucleotidyltransferase [Carboxydocella]AVX20713.1 polyribonucleotide nucleotidyltransferase [Carboxydocella thermautotrophica]AVX31132.1 polyribonucleotide nucleotidyltransferase [Carboxydocella thermautotrophica]SJZ86938.1 polyribonucleotide nucleotidyltransferase [Carboxydocella sporoproducens DSM 16521]